MRATKEQHQVTIHFDKPIQELTPNEIDYIWEQAEDLGEKCACNKVVLQTTKKAGYRKLNLICSKPAVLKN